MINSMINNCAFRTSFAKYTSVKKKIQVYHPTTKTTTKSWAFSLLHDLAPFSPRRTLRSTPR